MSALGAYPRIAKVLDLIEKDERVPPDFVRTEDAAWKDELKRASADPAAIDAILAARQGDPQPGEKDFWGWLQRFVFLGGFGEDVQDFARLLTENLIPRLEAACREHLFRLANDRRASYFFGVGRWFGPTLFGHFPPAFVAEWFGARMKAYGNDGAVNDLWRIVHDIAEQTPILALALIREPTFASVESGRQFQTHLLGCLRFRAGLPPEVNEGVGAVLGAMCGSSTPSERAHYLRTLKVPLNAGRLPNEELSQGLAAAVRTTEENAVGFELVISGARQPTRKPQTRQLLRWLAEQLDRTQPAEMQFHVATVVWLAIDQITPEELGFEPEALLLKIQPVDSAYLGVWQRIGDALYGLSLVSRDRLHHALRQFAARDWPLLQKMLEYNAPLYGVVSCLADRPGDTVAFAAELARSKIAEERRLGFYLIEQLQLPSQPTPSGVFTTEEFIVWLAEFRCNLVYRTIASQLVTAAARIDLADPNMVEAFKEEVLYQCKNYPGLCLDALKAKRAEVALLKKPVAAAEAYFAKLKELTASPIKAQQIPELLPAIRRKRMKDQVKMEGAVAAHSIFEQLAKKSYLLYGTRWAPFNNGQLGAEMPLQPHSVAAEYPRKVFIDPEGALIGQLTAQGDIERMRKQEGGPA
jgi:hypothetical protein